MKFKTRIVTKRDMQNMLSVLRKGGLTIIKLNAGYEVKTLKGVLLLKAMIGSRGYLVRMVENLFVDPHIGE